MSARRPLLLPFDPLYWAGLALKNRRYDTNPGSSRELVQPVLSVGGLSAGGSGKTPFLIALAALVRELGYAPDVLSRGYGRSTRGVQRVEPHGSAVDFGDEPLMLARHLGCPVFVSEERFEAGLRAESELPDTHRGIHLLDDGFSHRRLARAIDIVLFTAEDVCDTLLPAGNLREPLSSLRRADIVVLRAAEAEALRPHVHAILLKARKPVCLWTIERRMTLPVSLPAHPLVFSAIARPADFERMLTERGIHSTVTQRFRDHHRYTPADIETLLQKALFARADGWITTSKDAVKLTERDLTRLRTLGPVSVADAVVTLLDRDRCAEDLRRLLRKRTPLARNIVGPD